MVVALIGLAAAIALCVYCCVFRYKMCTPIVDPIDNPPANRQLYTYDFEVGYVVDRNWSFDHSLMVME